MAFSKKRDRLLEGHIAAKFLGAILSRPNGPLSVDGTLTEAWASMKSFTPKDGSGEPPSGWRRSECGSRLHGERRSNDTHASTTDPDARLHKKGKNKEAKLCFIDRGLMENSHGLLVDTCVTEARRYAERVVVLTMIGPFAERPQAISPGAEKAMTQKTSSKICGR